MRPLGHPALAADHLAEAAELAGEALAPLRQLVERLRHVAHRTRLLAEPHVQLSVPRLAERVDERLQVLLRDFDRAVLTRATRRSPPSGLGVRCDSHS